jgi:ribosome-associated heat shock protein Hsp15
LRNDTSVSAGKVRLDKWLWAARFYKTRSQSAAAIKAGRVMTDGDRAKASFQVTVGAELEVRKGPYVFDLEVIALADRRGNAELARSLYLEKPESITKREETARQISAMSRAGATGSRVGARPTKKDRRAMDAFKEQFFAPEDLEDDWD